MQAEANLIERIARVYVAYRSARLLSVLGVLLSALLLLVLAGGFPPYAWRLLAQTVPQIPTLLAARGPGVCLALFGVLLLSVTLLLAWCGLLWLSWRMLTYWRYERQELRNFAVDQEKAQSQAEERGGYATDRYAEEDFAEERSTPRLVARAVAPPATRRHVIYPPSPLTPSPDAHDAEQASASVENEVEPFFVDEEEDENEMNVYRDEEDEEGELAYAQRLAEHSSSSSVSAPGTDEGADNIRYSSYGRILPFSAAPSAGALPHLTTTLYNRVSLPRSVAPRSTDPLFAPSQPPTRQAASAQPIKPAYQSARLTQAVKPAQQMVEPQSAKSFQQAAPAQSMQQRTIPVQPAAPAPLPGGIGPMKQVAMPPAQPPLQHTVPARPVKQATASSSPHSVLAHPAHQLVALPPPVQSAMQARSAPQLSVQPPAQHSAMQSLVELITTVPLVPPQQEPIPIARPLGRTEANGRQPTTQLVVCTGLDVGLQRRGKPNEDSLLALQNTRILHGSSCPVGLFVVADGMGGHENGQEASRLVIQALSKTVVPSIIYGPSDDNYAELLAEGVHHANLEVYQRNRQVKADMGTTVVAALVVDSTAYIVSAGDSRVYLYRATSGLTQVTRDHSTVARLVENGLIKPEDVYTHPRRNEIYRSLGHHPSEELDKFILTLQPDDVLLLCSDGLWEMVRDTHIQEIISSTASQPEQTSAALVQAALDGGGKDNISVIAVYVKAAQGARSAWAG